MATRSPTRTMRQSATESVRQSATESVRQSATESVRQSATESVRQSVRERLTAAAFALFDERGYEQSTVDDIAERAGVGRTTFFRAFPSKENVIFPDHGVVLGAVRARLATSTQETALVAVSEAARLVLQHYLGEGEAARIRYKLTSSVPALRHREIASIQQYQHVFVEFIHGWMGGGPASGLRAELMATSLVTAHNYVLRRWLRGLTKEPETEFDAAMAEVFALFAEADPSPSPGGGTSLVVLQTTRQLDELIPVLRKLVGDPGSSGVIWGDTQDVGLRYGQRP